MTTTSPSGTGVASPQQRDGEPGAGPRAGGVLSLLAGLVRLARPRQWTKNLLVFAAPAAAGVLDNTGPALDAFIAFVAFCLAASGTYYINDARDAAADRLHPTKRNRPVASGVVPVAVAYVCGAVLLAASVAVAFAATPELAATILGYVALTTAYSTVLKNVAVVDLVAVAAGFVLRAVAGAAATDVPISDWFFIVTSFGALFIVSGKRGAEASEMAEATSADAGRFRPVLSAYSESYMAYLRSVTSGAVLVAYCLWAFEKAESALNTSSIPWYQLSILPFVMAILRYALVLDKGDRGSAPEDIILGDRTLQCIGVVWAIVFAVGVYTA
ncbi:MAG TPA: decaprenyl-phosphate phosphoribosyltransferase [Acidimicrobiales bacterium]|jgi:decaprenyl-phosphate phosphoribosyltransferase|nr:decaprenyl-phosphate phosphoribosyltransferase [Acidimicrobiales bacterium]